MYRPQNQITWPIYNLSFYFPIDLHTLQNWTLRCIPSGPPICLQTLNFSMFPTFGQRYTCRRVCRHCPAFHTRGFPRRARSHGSQQTSTPLHEYIVLGRLSCYLDVTGINKHINKSSNTQEKTSKLTNEFFETDETPANKIREAEKWTKSKTKLTNN